MFKGILYKVWSLKYAKTICTKIQLDININSDRALILQSCALSHHEISIKYKNENSPKQTKFLCISPIN